MLVVYRRRRVGKTFNGGGTPAHCFDEEPHPAVYRLKCTQAWLLIGFDLYAAGDAIHAPTEPFDFVVRSFDRVFCLNVVNRRISEIPRRAGCLSAGDRVEQPPRDVTDESKHGTTG